MSVRQRRDGREEKPKVNSQKVVITNKRKKEIHIAPEDVITKLADMPPEERPVAPAPKTDKAAVKAEETPEDIRKKLMQSEEDSEADVAAGSSTEEKSVKRIAWLDDEDDEEFDEDGDFLDDPDTEDDAEKLLKEKEEYLALKKERREQRKQKIKDFFAGFKKISLRDIWDKRYDVKDAVLEKAQKARDFVSGKAELDDIDPDLDWNARIKIAQNIKRIRLVLFITLGILLAAGMGLYYELRVFHSFKVLTKQERQDDNATEYVTLKGYRLKCNPNGVTCVNKKNEVIWNTTFSMQRPIVDKCGDLVAVGSQRGNEIYIFNEDGLLANFNVEHLLTKMKITKQGDVAVVLEDGQVTWINVYDKWGKILIRDKTTMPDSGYPLDMDISSNGYKMMISFLGVDDDIVSRVAFYNFSAVGQDTEGKQVNEKVSVGHVIPEVKFMEGNYAIAFRDDGATVFKGQQIPEECNSIDIDQEIISQFSNEKYFGFVTESDEEEPEHKFKMVIYRENGSRCGSVYFDFEYTNIVMSDKQVILYNSSGMRIYSITGKLQFSGNYDKEILKVIPTSSSRKFNILTNDSVDLIKIK